jgi:hypothetical protein
VENFIKRLVEINENNNVGGSERYTRITCESIYAMIRNVNGTIVLDCVDYGCDRVILFSEERHFPDTIEENRYVVLHWLHDGYIAALERGTFQECLDCLVEWIRTEVADIA